MAVDPTIAFIMDSVHDFLKPRGPGSDYELNGILGGIVEKDFPAQLDLYRSVARLPSSSEEQAAASLATFPATSEVKCKVSTDPVVNLANLNKVFSVFGPAYQVVNNVDAPLIHLLCDGGPMHLGSLAKNIKHYINIVHTVTPATACDSAGLKRGIVFGKPVIFEDGNGLAGEPLLSESAIFSKSSYHETSNVFDINSNINAVIHIGGGVAGAPEQTIDINSSGRGPTVNMLNKAIGGRVDGPYRLARFSNEVLFDIKRCGDSDQIGHARSLLQRNQTAQHLYVFATIDRICAYIASKYYKIPTILQTNSGTDKIFTIWNPGAPPIEAVPRGGQLEDEGMNRLAEPEFLDLITSLCADKVRSGISILNPEIAALCSYHTLTRYFTPERSIPDQLRDQYVERHNSLYARIGWGIYGGWPGGPSIAAKLRSVPPFDYTTFLTDARFGEYLKASSASIMEELNEAYDNRLVEFVADKYAASKACEILLKPVIGIVTLALIGDITQSPDDPGVSVISTVLFSGFLPPQRQIPTIAGWTRESQRIYSQLLVAISTKLEAGSPLAGVREVIRLIGGRRRKTFKRRHNGISRRSNKHTYRKTSRSDRKRGTSD